MVWSSTRMWLFYHHHILRSLDFGWGADHCSICTSNELHGEKLHFMQMKHRDHNFNKEKPMLFGRRRQERDLPVNQNCKANLAVIYLLVQRPLPVEMLLTLQFYLAVARLMF